MTRRDYRSHTILLTGASSGIGHVLAGRLAARGASLLLVARRIDRLDALAAELRAAHGVRIETLGLDLSEPRPGRRIRDAAESLGMSITGVVNNAGFGTDGPFRAEDPDRLATEIAVDIAAVVDITREFVDDLRAAGNGLLVNITSEAAAQPIPGMAVYAAAKGFVRSFTEALWWELKDAGVATVAFAPGLTATEFFDEIGTDQYPARAQSPQRVADALLRVLDRRRPGPTARANRGTAVVDVIAGLVGRRGLVQLTARVAGSARLMSARQVAA